MYDAVLPRFFSWWMFPIRVMLVCLETKVFLTCKKIRTLSCLLAYFMIEVCECGFTSFVL